MPKGGRWVKPTGFESPLWIPTGADYDETLPNKYELFCKTFLKFTEGFKAKQPVEWSQWQLDRISRPILGLRWKKNGLRVIRNALFQAGRGNAKSTKAAGLSLFFLLASGEPNPEVDLFAKNKPQAGRMFRVISRFIRESAELDANVNVSSHLKQILVPATGAELVVRSGDAESELGLNPSFAVMDELLAQRNSELFDVIRQAFGKRPEGCFMIMTTPAVSPDTFAQEEYINAKQIEADRSLDPTYLPIIYEADEKDDIFDRRTWQKANPGLGVFLDEEVIAREAEEAKRDKTKVHPFKVYRCAQWADAGSGFIDMSLWNGNVIDFDGIDLHSMSCYFGLDMAGTTDLASLAMLWWNEEEDVAYVLWRHWTTDKMTERLNSHTKGNWRLWIADTAVNLHSFSEDWIDGNAVAEEVIELAMTYKPEDIGIDSYRGKEMYSRLYIDGGLNVTQLSQTGRAMEAGLERTQQMVSKERLKHNGDPVSRWCAQNTIVKYDNLQFPKIQKRDLDVNVRIDAMAALNMAMDRRLAHERGDIGDTFGVYDFEDDDEEDIDVFEDEDTEVGKKVLVAL